MLNRKTQRTFEQNAKDKKSDKKNKNDEKSYGKKVYTDKKSVEGKKRDGEDELCPVFTMCGGCEQLDAPYQKQLKEKKKYLKELLKEYTSLEEMIGMENPFNYRNKVHATFDIDHGKIIAGTYKKNSHDVVSVDDCMIQNKKANEIICTIRDMCKGFRIKTYDEDTGYGLLRHVLIRHGYHTGEYMVVLVLGSPILPSKNNFVKALRTKHPEVSTVIVNVNNKKTSMILGDKETTIYGKGYIEDVLCGKRFRISPKSFYQINPLQTEILYNKAIEYANLKGNEIVVDAYCGTGTIGMVAADKAKEVIGVELNSDAVRDARANAKANNVRNISFYNKDAGDFLIQMAEQNAKVDVVMMDPPRAGSDDAFLSAVLMLKPEKVVYISCNPETLVDDLEFLTAGGYRVDKAVGVDMFPHTRHVECVVLMTKVEK